MGLQIAQPWGPEDFINGLLAADPVRQVEQNASANAMDNAYAAAGLRPAGPQAVLQAFGIGPSLSQQVAAQQQVAQEQAAAAAAARQRQQQAMVDQATQAAINDPSADNYRRLFLVNPQAREAIQASHNVLDQDQQNARLRDTTTLLSLAATGDQAGFQQQLQARIDAAKAAGHDTADAEHILELSQDPKNLPQIAGILNLRLAGVLGPDKAAEVINQYRTAQETERSHRADEQNTYDANHKPVVVGNNDVLVDPYQTGPANPQQPQPAAPGGQAPAPTGGVYDQVGQVAGQAGANAGEQAYLRRLAQVESKGDPTAKNGSSTGLFQFHPDTFAAAGGGNINDVGDQTRAALTLARRDAVALQHAGITPDPSTLYLMHQQGTGGGLALLTAPPEVNAVAALTPVYRSEKIARQAIINNGGTPNMTAGQFVDMWRQKFNGGGAQQPQAQAQPQAQPQGQGGQARVLYDNREPPDPNDPSNQPPDPDTVALQAGIYLGKGTLPPLGVGKYAAAWKTAILQEATKQAKALGLSANDIIAGTVSIKAAGAALQQSEKTLQAVRGSEGAVQRNADLALSLMPKGVGTTGVPVFNAWQQHVRDQVFGDPNVSQFNLALKTVADEYARVMSTNTGAGGQTSDSARNEAYSRLATSATPQQLQANIATMKQEMANRINSLQSVHDGLQASIRGGYGAGGAAYPGAAPPSQPQADPAAQPRWRAGPGGKYPVYSPADYARIKASGKYSGKQFYDEQGNLRTIP